MAAIPGAVKPPEPMRTPSLLTRLQQLLQRLYAIDLDESIDDYVITDARLARILRGGESTAPEELLVAESEDALEVSLYLAPELLAAIEDADPLERLQHRHVSPLCTLLEGVSHFLYLISRARAARSVTRLELELQAEVDKYAVLGYLLRAQRQGSLPAWLPHWLFEAVRYRADLDAEARSRYTTANAYARRYCRRLQRRFQWAWNGRALMAELRHFHHLAQPQKLRYIDSLA